MVPYLWDAQVLLVALDSVGEVSQRRVDGAHVAQLAGLGELALGLSGKQHALLVAGQGVRVVADGHVHVAQAAEGVRCGLEFHIDHRYCWQTGKYVK